MLFIFMQRMNPAMPDFPVSQFGHAFEQRRISKGHTMVEAQRETGLQYRTILNCIRYPGSKRPARRTILALARYVAWAQFEVRAGMREPYDAPEYDYPLVTHCGTAYGPPVTGPSVFHGPAGGQGDCSRCEYLEPCRVQVLERDGFAMCEAVIDADLLTAEELEIVAQNGRE